MFAITQAPINLGQLAKRAHLNHEYFILEQDRIPVIGVYFMGGHEINDYVELRDTSVRAQIVSSLDVAAGPPC